MSKRHQKKLIGVQSWCVDHYWVAILFIDLNVQLLKLLECSSLIIIVVNCILSSYAHSARWRKVRMILHLRDLFCAIFSWVPRVISFYLVGWIWKWYGFRATYFERKLYIGEFASSSLSFEVQDLLWKLGCPKHLYSLGAISVAQEVDCGIDSIVDPRHS